MSLLSPPRANQVHNVSEMMGRWQKLAKVRGLVLKPFFEVEGTPLYFVTTQCPDPQRPWLYCSAGIHGDEPAGSEALLRWVEEEPCPINVLLFPCLNPWGLLNNSRLDTKGRDLNRTYHDDSVPQTAAHRALLQGRKVDLALFLHEDYDAQGIYIYEIVQEKPHLAERLLEASCKTIPRERRQSVEGFSCDHGVVREAVTPDFMQFHPEAFFVHFALGAHALTIETPSEFHIDDRVEAQQLILKEAVRFCLE